MTEFSSSRDELIASLTTYTSLLAARNEALSRLSATSAEVRSTLRNAKSPDISAALQRRDQDITYYSKLCGNKSQEEAAVNAAIAASNAANDELGQIARSVIALHEDSQILMEEVLVCQRECETLLKSRLETTSKALRQSSERRKLDAVYGPAIKHETPTFMDKQS